MITIESGSAEDELSALRRSVRDLAALAALPATWITSDLKAGLQNFAEFLAAALRARFVFIRLRPSPDEVVDAAAQNSRRAQSGFVDEVRRHLALYLDLDGNEFNSTIPSPEGGHELRVALSHVVVEGHIRGVVLACAPVETGLPDQERLLLHTGAAQVAILLQRHAIESAREAAARKLQEQARLLKGLNQVGTALVAELDLEKIVERVADVGRQITGAAFGAFIYRLHDERGESDTLFTPSGEPREALSKFLTSPTKAAFNFTFQAEGVVRLGDARKDPRFGEDAPHYGTLLAHLPVVSYLAVPVRSRTGEVLGGLFYGHPEVDVFSPDAETGLVSLAAQAAIAIDNANLYAALQMRLERAKQADEATRRLALIVQSSDDAIVAKDLNGVIVSWNPGAERIFGYSADEIVGRPIYTIIPPERHHEEAEILTKIRRGERVVHYETVRRAKDGRVVDISLTVSPLKLANGDIVGASKIARDVTEKKRVESQQRALHELADTVNRAAALPAIYDAALRAIRRFHGADRAAVLLYDAAGVMRFVAWDGLSESYRNAAEGHSPWKREDFDARPLWIDDITRGDLDPTLRAVIEREGIKALAFIPLTFENRLRGKFMVYFDRVHSFTAEELRPIETVASQVAFAIERRKSASELESLVTERTASLQKAIEQMEEFSYSVSHDLRSPARAMRGYAEAILADYGSRLDDEGRELLGRIQRNGSRMDRLIQDLLTYTRLARREVRMDVVSLDRLVREIIDHYPEMSPKVATIEIHSALPDVMAHEPSLMQAVSNLLSNAVKFVPRGTRPYVKVRSDIIGGRGRLWVEDNGIGIPAEFQQRLFGMFERAHGDQKFEGTGIGLAIVRKAVERMNGATGVVSDGKSGSRFWIELPLAKKK